MWQGDLENRLNEGLVCIHSRYDGHSFVYEITDMTRHFATFKTFTL